MIKNVKKSTILVVDDEPTNLDILTNLLSPYYKVKAAINSEVATNIMKMETRPDLILLDIMMPKVDGYELCRWVKSNPFTSEIPIIFVTTLYDQNSEKKGFELGAVDYIMKPIRPEIVLARVDTHLQLADRKKQLAHDVRERTRELHATQHEIILRLVQATKYRDQETFHHLKRISEYSRILAENLGLSEEWVSFIHDAAPIHDIGKIGIPDKVLQKKGKLTKKEFQLMKTHTTIGAEIISDHYSNLLSMARDIALNHHERWDGSGYPNGLRGEDIPLSARIVSVADVFDALTTKRSYKQAWSFDDAFEYIVEQSEKMFDPKVIKAFQKLRLQVEAIYEQFKEL